ncbi:hypothetical protein C8F01DRAFT_700136 [Mycena amicta]|nr:hypothetical protein C8F01DRAFT_700136 [Mycena amicta]
MHSSCARDLSLYASRAPAHCNHDATECMDGLARRRSNFTLQFRSNHPADSPSPCVYNSASFGPPLPAMKSVVFTTLLLAPTLVLGLLDVKIKAKGKKYFGSAADPATINTAIDVTILTADYGAYTPENRQVSLTYSGHCTLTAGQHEMGRNGAYVASFGVAMLAINLGAGRPRRARK